MDEHEFKIKDGRVLVIREVAPEDAGAILAYLEEISGESDFLNFGPGEFDMNETQEREY